MSRIIVPELLNNCTFLFPFLFMLLFWYYSLLLVKFFDKVLFRNFNKPRIKRI